MLQTLSIAWAGFNAPVLVLEAGHEKLVLVTCDAAGRKHKGAVEVQTVFDTGRLGATMITPYFFSRSKRCKIRF